MKNRGEAQCSFRGTYLFVHNNQNIYQAKLVHCISLSSISCIFTKTVGGAHHVQFIQLKEDIYDGALQVREDGRDEMFVVIVHNTNRSF